MPYLARADRSVDHSSVPPYLLGPQPATQSFTGYTQLPPEQQNSRETRSASVYGSEPPDNNERQGQPKAYSCSSRGHEELFSTVFRLAKMSSDKVDVRAKCRCNLEVQFSNT